MTVWMYKKVLKEIVKESIWGTILSYNWALTAAHCVADYTYVNNDNIVADCKFANMVITAGVKSILLTSRKGMQKLKNRRNQ